jgi:hypothetical protein
MTAAKWAVLCPAVSLSAAVLLAVIGDETWIRILPDPLSKPCPWVADLVKKKKKGVTRVAHAATLQLNPAMEGYSHARGWLIWWVRLSCWVCCFGVSGWSGGSGGSAGFALSSVMSLAQTLKG